MDKAGRVVIPAAIRAGLGMQAGPVDIVIDGSGIRIEVPASDELVEKDGRLVIAADGRTTSADDIRELRVADQR